MIYSRAKFYLYRIYKTGTPKDSYSISGVTGGSHSQHREVWLLSLPASPTFVSCYRSPSYRHANKPIAAHVAGDQKLTSPPPHPAFAKYMLIGQGLGVRLANQLSFTGNVCQKFLGL